jgi:hypothetical protein
LERNYVIQEVIKEASKAKGSIQKKEDWREIRNAKGNN